MVSKTQSPARTITRTQIVPAQARPIVIRQDSGKKSTALKEGAKRGLSAAKTAARQQEAVIIGAATGAALAVAEAKAGLPTSGLVDLGIGVALLIAGNAMKSDKLKAAAAGAASVAGYKMGVEFASKTGGPVRGDTTILGDLDGDLDALDGELF